MHYAFLNLGLMEVNTELCTPHFAPREVAVATHWTGDWVVCSRVGVDTLMTKENF
jgi:hypothetical protein